MTSANSPYTLATTVANTATRARPRDHDWPSRPELPLGASAGRCRSASSKRLGTRASREAQAAIGRGIASVATVTALLVSALGSATAQGAFCISCQAKRWDGVDSILQRRAQALITARDLARAAEARGGAALLERTKSHLTTVESLWNEAYRSGVVLGSSSYKTHLEQNLAEINRSYSNALGEWQKKVDRFRRLQAPLAEQRAKVLADMQGIIDEDAKQRRQLGFNGVFAAAKFLEMKAHEKIAELMKAPNGLGANAAQIARLNKFIGATMATDAGKAAFEAGHKNYWEAGAEVSQFGLEIVVPATARIHPVVVAMKPIVTIGLDFVSIGLSHHEWREANERLAAVDETELNWQFDIALAAAKAENLKREREMATYAIRRQELFSKQLQIVQAGVKP